VFATDVVLAALMAAPRSSYTWELIFNRVGDQLFIDKRDGSQLDFYTVGETAPNTASFDDRDDVNSAAALTLETTFVNDCFQQQVLKKDEKHDLGHPNPFSIEEGSVANIGYRYRQWNLGNEWTLISRTELDGVMKSHDQDVFIAIKALNEYDPKASGVDYRQKIDSQRGAVFVTEARNNSYKLARWTSQALLAGVEQIRLG
jgi:translation initiation factor 3 subunit D